MQHAARKDGLLVRINVYISSELLSRSLEAAVYAACDVTVIPHTP